MYSDYDLHRAIETLALNVTSGVSYDTQSLIASITAIAWLAEERARQQVFDEARQLAAQLRDEQAQISAVRKRTTHDD